MGTILVEALALFLGTVSAAALVGGFRWVRAVTLALTKLTAVTEQLSGVSADVLRVRRELVAHVREADARWHRIVPHSRYLTADDRVPEPAGSSD